MKDLHIVDNMAFVVSKNNVVITAVNKNLKKIFTNIDGAVIV